MKYEPVPKGTEYTLVPCGEQVQIRTTPYKGVRIGTPVPCAEEPDELVLHELFIAAARACDFHGDGDRARDEMRAACMATPAHLRADLLEHLNANYPPDADASGMPMCDQRGATDTGVPPPPGKRAIGPEIHARTKEQHDRRPATAAHRRFKSDSP